jgi:hypothetical protein
MNWNDEFKDNGEKRLKPDLRQNTFLQQLKKQQHFSSRIGQTAICLIYLPEIIGLNLGYVTGRTH